jgi:hypothetical protein
MKQETPHSNRSPEKRIKTQGPPKWREDLMDMGIMNVLTMRDDILIDMGKELVQWAQNSMKDPASENITVGEFFALKGISADCYQRWARRNEEFASLIKFAKQLIGYKLVKGLTFKRLEPKAVLFMLHNYDPEWKDMEQYHDERAKALKADELASQNITVVMEKFPDSKLVPVKED